ncbi:hypothetical protein DFJ63DRAFT_336225 [Scheffersomyces coipomensis]|uniref:uncharacterized protein n=1 Tax=Scheffersomyces coipomensis TaxID=1788519 RepID=UPI00315D6D76
MSGDYGGLGIVLEEREPPSSTTTFTQHKKSITSISSSSIITPSGSESMSRRQSHNEILLTTSADKIIGNTNTVDNEISSQISTIMDINASRSLDNDGFEPNNHVNSTTTIQEKSAIETETLLPPLPDDSSDLIPHSSTLIKKSLVVDTSSISGTNSLTSPLSSSIPVLNNPFTVANEDFDNQNPLSTLTSNNTSTKEGEISSLHQSDFSEFLNQDQSFSNYELDSPSLVIDSSNYQIFPSLTPSNGNNSAANLNNGSTSIASTMSGNNNQVNAPSTNSSSTNNSSSPLKRLKSLKNGIRKLSLGSSNNSSSSLPPPSTASQVPQPQPLKTSVSARPSVSPLQEELVTSLSQPQPFRQQQQSRSSTSSSSNSSLLSHLNPNPTTSSVNTKGKRSRTLSNSAMLTPVTPPLTSPIITISENLSATKKALSNIEQNYFDVINSKFNSQVLSSSSESESSNSILRHQARESQIVNDSEFVSRGRVNSISELTSSNELFGYADYLKRQKQSITDAFELTKKHLIDSGWCSDHDLNNLQLQQDSSMSQLDTKLLQIEEKLNREFEISLLNDSYNEQVRSRTSSMKKKQLAKALQNEKDLPISPSLKVLESRCFSFADI